MPLTEQEQKVSDAMELIPTLWVKKYKIKTSAGLSIEFDNHYFMRDLFNDMSALQVWLKPPQIGASETQIIKTLYVAKKNKWDIIYTLPTQSDVNDMAGGKINRIIAQNPILGKWVKDHDTVEQKAVGDHIIHYRGTYSNKQAMMVSSDLNVHDEVDASDAEVIAQYETRLQAKADGRRWYFSHPSIAGFGVDIQWQQSDKKEWFIKCPHCKEQQQLKWPDNIDKATKKYICQICKKELTDDSRRYGEWKATSDGVFSGYHISQLMCAWISAEKIVDDFYGKSEQYFSNYVLGLPFIGSDSKISSEEILRNCDGMTNGQEGRIIIGVDTGLPIHYTLMNKQGIFYYGTCKDYDVLEKLLLKFHRSIMVSDQGGDLIGIRVLQSKFIGRVFLCYYRKDRKTQELIRWGDRDEFGIVVVDRNRMIQLMVDQFRDVGRITLNGTREDFKEYASHFDSLYKVVTETNYGAEFVWERNGADHFCFDKDTKIKTPYGDRKIKDIKVGDRVETRNGYEIVEKSWLTKTNAKTVTAIFSNGSKIIATPNHKFITYRGETTLDSILYSDKLYEWKKSYIEELLTDDTRTLKGEQIESTTLQMERSGLKVILDFISKYGLIPMELFLKGISFITKMVIRLIMKYQTWLVKKEALIKVNTKVIDWNNLITEEEIKNISQKYNYYPINGGIQKLEKNGIVNMLIKVSYYLNQNILSVLSAILHLQHKALTVVSSAHQDVVIVGLHENIGLRNVYNLTVSPNHEYYANGILVSNCHATLYMLVGFDKFAQDLSQIIKKDSFLQGIPTASDSLGMIPASRIRGIKRNLDKLDI